MKRAIIVVLAVFAVAPFVRGGGIFDGYAGEAKIAFASDRDSNWEIYVMNADGTGVTRLTNEAATDSYPAFSADGSQIAFASRRDGNEEIYVMNADGSGQTNLTNNVAFDRDPAFSPDGSKIVFRSRRDGNWEIYVMNVDGTGVTRLTNSLTYDADPSFSPDGSKIAFTSRRDGNYEVYVMNTDGTGVTRLTNNPAHDGDPTFSPDGTKIAFRTDIGLGNFEIYVMNADGTGRTNLTNNAALDFYPSFPLLPSTTVPPNSFSIFRGFLTGGDLSDLFESDDRKLSVRAHITLFPDESPLQVIVTGTAPVETPSELRFTLEASVSTPGLMQTVFMFDYVTGLYEQVDFWAGTPSDSIVEVVITTNPERFVQAGTREMKAKIAYTQVGITLHWPWSANLDRTVWKILP